ncbi:MAG: CarD family transcriptional regulator [Reyranellaceae bacterium]
MPTKSKKAAAKPKAGARKTVVAKATRVETRAKPAARTVVKLVASKPQSKPKPEAVKPKVVEAPKVDVKPKIEAKPKMVEFVFEKGDFVVYPTHGVGRVVDIEAKQIAGQTLDLFVISFEQDRMTLRVPVAKARTSGLRKLSSRKIMDTALVTLKGRSRVSRAMWNRRAQEYEAKINSGDPVSIAEVVRDLHRNAGQPDQSYSERQIYEAALDRLARELAAVERIDKDAATLKLQSVLKQAA